VQILTSSNLASQTVEVFKVIGGGHTAEGPIARYAGGVPKLLQTIKVTGTESFNLQPLQIVIPIETIPDSNGQDYINLEFRFPTPLKPMNLIGGNSDDSRELTLGLISAVFQ
jgi:hypothetical protein